MKEVFKDIPNYEGIYQISNLGNARSLDRYVKHINGSKRLIKGIILKPPIGNHGYRVISLSRDCKTKSRTVHQIVAEVFLNHKPNGYSLVINHINFNKLDNRVENLEIVTPRVNANQKHIKSSSNYVGVTWCKHAEKWLSRIEINGKKIHLGSFSNEEEASKYYESALISYNNGNNIKVKRRIFTSKYEGVSWSKSAKNG